MFEVRWIQSALDELMERWMEADSRLRAAITTSVNVIDVRLARNPLTEGKAREGAERVCFIDPPGCSVRSRRRSLACLCHPRLDRAEASEVIAGDIEHWHRFINMNGLNYHEDKELDRFIIRNFSKLMTDFERRVWSLAIKREKAQYPGCAADRLARWLQQETEEVIRASLAGSRAVQQQIRERILRDHEKGEVPINRCPVCERIVRTPMARQ